MKLDVVDALALIFVTLKLCGVIEWRWPWVISPWLIQIGLVVFIRRVLGITDADAFRQWLKSR